MNTHLVLLSSFVILGLLGFVILLYLDGYFVNLQKKHEQDAFEVKERIKEKYELLEILDDFIYTKEQELKRLETLIEDYKRKLGDKI